MYLEDLDLPAFYALVPIELCQMILNFACYCYVHACDLDVCLVTDL